MRTEEVILILALPLVANAFMSDQDEPVYYEYLGCPVNIGCFYITTQPFVFSHAEALCNARGPAWSLLKMTDNDDLKYIDEFLQGQSLSASFHIGLSRDSSSESFKWEDGTSPTPEMWSPSQPAPSSALCAVLEKYNSQHTITPSFCSMSYGFICRVQPESTTEVPRTESTTPVIPSTSKVATFLMDTYVAEKTCFLESMDKANKMECARYCLQHAHLTCASFAYDSTTSVCAIFQAAETSCAAHSIGDSDFYMHAVLT